MNKTKTLETDRLILRKITIDDAEGLYKNWASDEQTNKYIGYKLHYNVEQTKKLIYKWISEYYSGAIRWCVELKETHEIIGMIHATTNKLQDKSTQVGYSYGSKFWGNGYATEALEKVIAYLFENCDFYIVESVFYSWNEASGRVMEKAGMRKDAELRSRAIHQETGERGSIIYYSITKDEYEKMKNK